MLDHDLRLYRLSLADGEYKLVFWAKLQIALMLGQCCLGWSH